MDGVVVGRSRSSGGVAVSTQRRETTSRDFGTTSLLMRPCYATGISESGKPAKLKGVVLISNEAMPEGKSCLVIAKGCVHVASHALLRESSPPASGTIYGHTAIIAVIPCRPSPSVCAAGSTYRPRGIQLRAFRAGVVYLKLEAESEPIRNMCVSAAVVRCALTESADIRQTAGFLGGY